VVATTAESAKPIIRFLIVRPSLGCRSIT
jgi:hypothetical protein